MSAHRAAARTAGQPPGNRPLFSLGKVVITPGALELLTAKGVQPIDFLTMHATGEWGDLAAEDKQANTDALQNGARILSAHKLGAEKIWVITDACDDDGARHGTCILLPEEY